MAVPARRVLSEVREYFLLKDSDERARSLEATTVSSLRDDLALSIQKRNAAELLFHGGSAAEALLLAKNAFLLVDKHAALAPDVVDDPDKLRAAIETLPTRDDELTSEHAALFDKLIAAQLAYHHAFAGVVLAPDERKRTRVSRVGGAAFLVLGALLAAVMWLRRTDLTAEASGSWGATYPPAYAIDGNEQTHWLLPDKSPGHLDVKIYPPRKLSTVSILNGYDPPNYGVIDYVLEARSGEEVVKSIPGTFKNLGTGKQPWVDIAVNADRKIDRVRIVVKTYHNLGGAIAEVKVQ